MNKSESIRNNQIKRYCEFCGKEVVTPYYSYIATIKFYIPKSSDQIERVSDVKIYMKDGRVINYDIETSDQFVVLEKGHEHLLCSKDCENWFLDKYPRPYFLSELENLGIAPNNTSSGAFYSFIAGNCELFNPPSYKRCEICGQYFPFLGRVWNETMEILSETQGLGTKDRIPFDTKRYSAISGTSNKNPEGMWYGYEIKNINPITHDFCSFDCAFEYSKMKNAMIVTTSILEKKKSGIIVSSIENINQDLNNKTIHRPFFISDLI